MAKRRGFSLDEIVKFRPFFDLPIGKAAVMNVGQGVSRGLSTFISGFLKVNPKISPAFLAFLMKLDFVQGFVGDDISELLSTMALMEAFEQNMNLGGMAQALITPAVPAVAPRAAAWYESIPLIGPIVRSFTGATPLVAAPTETQGYLGQPDIVPIDDTEEKLLAIAGGIY